MLHLPRQNLIKVMIKLKILLFLLLPICVSSQILSKKEVPSFAAMFVSGMADGLNQTLEYRYSNFKKIFPNANDKFWNPAISWTNKWKNGVESNGEKFIGSSSVFVAFTDGYHATRLVEHLGMSGSVALKINLFQKKRWYFYVIDVARYWIVNRIGFVLVYDGVNLK